MTNNADTKMEVDEPKKENVKPTEKDLKSIFAEEIKEHCIALEKGEHHIWGRLLQNLHKTRKQLYPELFAEAIAWPISWNSAVKEYFAKYGSASASPAQSSPMEVDQKSAKSPNLRRKVGTQEGDIYLLLLASLHFLDEGMLDAGKEGILTVISRMDEMDRRYLDIVTARCLYYFALIAEKEGRLNDLRSVFNSRLRTATLRHMNESQAVLINTLLRIYLLNRDYESAAHLVSKVRFPDSASNNDLARFLYYQGRIRALQLDYTAAAGFFMNALRKAPQEAAIGFKQNAQKWVVVISLLQGEIPERSIFRQPIYRKCLAPYLELTQAVRLGDLTLFNKVVNQYSAVFEKDETLTLIVRLRQNVIKTAVKQISLAYSRITIKDIAKKLQLANEVDTEYMVAKAIADGAIDASITCDTKDGLRYMQSSETADIYRTVEPQMHFDTRIRYCLDLHNHAVKALRYPPKNKIEVETIEAQREREQQELEFAKELAEEDDDDF